MYQFSQSLSSLNLFLKSLTIAALLAMVGFLMLPGMCLAKSQAKKHIELGNFLYYHGDLDAAIDRFEKAAELEPDSVEAHMSLVNLYLKRKKREEAIEHARQLVKLDPDSEEAHLMLGNLLRADKESLAEAASEFELVLNLSKENPRLRTSLGYMYLNLKKLPEALATFEKAIEENSRLLDTYLGVAITKFHMGRKQEAFDDIDKLSVKFKKDKGSINVIKGQLLYATGDKKAAVDAFKNAIDAQPNSVNACEKLGDIYLSEKQWKEAIGVYKRAIEINPASSLVYRRLGVAFLNDEKLQEAKKAFLKACQLNDKDALAFYSLAHVFIKEKDLGTAATYFESGAKVDDDVKRGISMQNLADKLRGKETKYGALTEAPRKMPRILYGDTVFNFSYSGLLNLPDSRWNEMEKKLKNSEKTKVKNSNSMKKNKPHMVPGRLH